MPRSYYLTEGTADDHMTSAVVNRGSKLKLTFTVDTPGTVLRYDRVNVLVPQSRRDVLALQSYRSGPGFSYVLTPMLADRRTYENRNSAYLLTWELRKFAT